MRAASSPPSDRLDLQRRGGPWKTGLLLALAVLCLVPGCRGCREDPAARAERLRREKEEAQRKEKEKPKPDFEPLQLAVQPTNLKSPVYGSKPGHWSSVTLETKTNNFDFLGELELGAVDGEGEFRSLLAMPYALATRRPIALPKGQPKQLETQLFVPANGIAKGIAARLLSRGANFRVFEALPGWAAMPSYQYFLVVLAKQPQRYGYLAGLDAVRPPGAGLTGSSTPDAYYRVALLPGDRRPPLPAHALFWTSIAYLVWDDVEPERLDSDQRQALLDWLHWGGQLLVSGPDSLDTLRNSFLAPYLPATRAAARDLAPGDFAAMNRRFTPAGGQPLTPESGWHGVTLAPHGEAHFVPGCGDLLAERAVGRGRIVVSAFPLSGQRLVQWSGWDNAFNACLLRHLPRRYQFDRGNEIELGWAAPERDKLDPRLITAVRYFARDQGTAFAEIAADVLRQRNLENPQPNVNPWSSDPAPPLTQASTFGAAGVAAWNDFSPVAKAARETLQEAARIQVPARSFVVWVVAAYLVVLVPVNWSVFRLVRRVEWAWAAAPVIALAWTGVVIHLAQLDIGFVRSQSELAVVEAQPGYRRAHVTRYAALYSSLATHYTLHFENDPGAVAQPFPTESSPDAYQLLPGQFRSLVYDRREAGTTLSGIRVSAASTGLVHSEQMVDLGGTIRVLAASDERVTLANQTDYALHDALVVRRTRSATRAAWLGTLDAGATAAADFAELKQVPQDGPLWLAARAGEIELRRVARLAQDEQTLQPGDLRLIARLAEALPGARIEPAAAQRQVAGVLVAHLQHAPPPDPEPDVNTRDAVQRAERKQPAPENAP